MVPKMKSLTFSDSSYAGIKKNSELTAARINECFCLNRGNNRIPVAISCDETQM